MHSLYIYIHIFTFQKIHLLQLKSVKFLTDTSENFSKPELLIHSLTNISFTEPNNHKSLYDITLGDDCEKYVSELMEQGHADIITTIRELFEILYYCCRKKLERDYPLIMNFYTNYKLFDQK